MNDTTTALENPLAHLFGPNDHAPDGIPQSYRDELTRLQRQNTACRNLLARALDAMALWTDGDSLLMTEIRYELGAAR